MIKKISLFCTLWAAHAIALAIPPEFFSLNATPTWKEFCLYTPPPNLRHETRAWTGFVTLKSKEPLKLTTLVLQWQGEKVWKLAASLYQKKERHKELIPIQENWICDGHWDAHAQQLRFTMNEKLVAVNQYHLVLNFPKHAKHKIRKGSFVIKSTHVKKLVCN
jgi:hypothetical protein